MRRYYDFLRRLGLISTGRRADPVVAHGHIPFYLALGCLSLILAQSAHAQAPPKAPTITLGSDTQVVHNFTELPLDSKGWTNFEALTASGYEDARVVFVSSSEGNDATGQIYGINDVTFDSNGMFQAAGAVNAYASIAAAYAQCREGYPDIMLLNRGGEWVEMFNGGSAGNLKSGRSISQRHIIASYGSGNRPQIKGVSSNTVIMATNTLYTVISGIRVYRDDWRTAQRGIDLRWGSQHILLEDVRFDRMHKNIMGHMSGETISTNIVVRRSIFDQHNAHDGIWFVAGITNPVFEENVFSRPFMPSYPNEDRHGRIMYMNAGETNDAPSNIINAHFIGNILYHSERGGFDGRGGGYFDNNIFIGSSLGFAAAGGGNMARKLLNGAVTNNVFTESSPNTLAPSEFFIRGVSGVLISRNIWTNIGAGTHAAGVNVRADPTYGGTGEYRMIDVEVSENIFYGYRQLNAQYGEAFVLSSRISKEPEDYFYQPAFNGNVVRDNDWQMVTGAYRIATVTDDQLASGGITFSGNRYYASSVVREMFIQGGFAEWVAASGETDAQYIQVSYPDPSRTIGTYSTSLGGAPNSAAFVQGAIANSRHNWNPAYTAPAANDYIRTGFGR